MSNPTQTAAAFLKLMSAQYDTADQAVDAVLDTIVTTYTPEQFGRDFDALVQLPQPFESWDDKAAEWLYEFVFEQLKDIDFTRDPANIAERAWRKARGLSRHEQNAAALLLELADGSVKATAAVNTLVALNSRELKRRDTHWLLKQALRNAKHPEARASIERAMAKEPTK